MKKKRQIQSQNNKIRAVKEQRADKAWRRLLKIREKLGKPDPAAVSAEKPTDEVMDRLAKIAEEIGNDWQSEKSATEILSEMRR